MDEFDSMSLSLQDESINRTCVRVAHDLLQWHINVSAVHIVSSVVNIVSWFVSQALITYRLLRSRFIHHDRNIIVKVLLLVIIIYCFYLH